MNKTAPLQPFLVLSTLAFCALTVACAGPVQSVSFGRSAVAQAVGSTQNPLVAQYVVATACPGQVMVEFGPDTSYGRNTAWYPTPGGYSKTSVIVAGMKASTTYHMRSQVQCASGETETGADSIFETGPLPPAMPFPTLTVTRPSPSGTSSENPGIELIDVISPADNLMQAFFTDRDANPIWYYEMAPGYSPQTIKFLPNGHLIFSLTRSADSILREVDLSGNTIREMDIVALQQKVQDAGFDFVPSDLHHDLLPLPNGHVIVLTNFARNLTLQDYSGPVIGDALIDLDENWNPVWAWNSFDFLNPNRHLNGLPDWTHSNAIVYTADGNLLLSMRHQSWVIKIDYNNGTGAGTVLWRFGYQGDFSLAQDGVSTDDPSLWFSFQHFPSIISQNGPQTTLAVWDNGDNRVLDASGTICIAAPQCFSRATIFEIDESAMVADLFWADPLPWFGVWGGSINQLENGNVEFDLNAAQIPPSPNVASQVQEVTQTSTPQVVWQMQISPVAQTAYRAYRVPSLYPGVSWVY